MSVSVLTDDAELHLARPGTPSRARTGNPYKPSGDDHPKGPFGHLFLGVLILLGALCFPAGFYFNVKAATKFFYGGDIKDAKTLGPAERKEKSTIH